MFEKIKKIAIEKKKKINSQFNKHAIRKSSKYFSLTDLVGELKAIGVNSGDILLLHSSLKSIGYVENGPTTVIKSILNVIGPDGTLVVPTYPIKGNMYQTCIKKNYMFDYYKSPTTLGAIPSSFLRLNGISRSIHPTHSISAIGKYAKQITEKHHIGNKTFGENSPWAKIYELNGKIFGVGIGLGPTTQYHYIEDIMGDKFPIKVKMDKIYKLKCKDDKRNLIYVEVQPLDPEVAKNRIDNSINIFISNYFWEIYQKLGILKIGKIGEAKSWIVNARKFIDILFKLVKIGITIYSTEQELKSKNLYPFELIQHFFI